MRDAFPDATIAFIDLPESMHTLAEGDLRAGVDDLLRRPWTDDALCEDIARRVADVGWVRRVGSVHRLANGRFDISAEYRRPVALVQKESQFVLVDGHGVRLPGRYAYDPRWPLIQGVAAPVPSPGATWPGDDLRAGLAVLERIEPEPFRDQITAILVDNFGGRIHPRSSHIELATDQAGGRIGWGSAPGAEVEENDVEQKLALLRATYRETGRVDGHHAVIDVSTYADRYTIPG